MKQLTTEALSAYTGAMSNGFTYNPFLESSPKWYAHELGIYFYNQGMSAPRMVAMSRGYSIRANDMLFKIHHDKQSIIFERIN